MGTGSVLGRPRLHGWAAPLFLDQPPDVCRKRAPGRHLPWMRLSAQPVLFAGGGDGRAAGRWRLRAWLAAQRANRPLARGSASTPRVLMRRREPWP